MQGSGSTVRRCMSDRCEAWQTAGHFHAPTVYLHSAALDFFGISQFRDLSRPISAPLNTCDAKSLHVKRQPWLAPPYHTVSVRSWPDLIFRGIEMNLSLSSYSCKSMRFYKAENWVKLAEAVWQEERRTIRCKMNGLYQFWWRYPPFKVLQIRMWAPNAISIEVQEVCFLASVPRRDFSHFRRVGFKMQDPACLTVFQRIKTKFKKKAVSLLLVLHIELAVCYFLPWYLSDRAACVEDRLLFVLIIITQRSSCIASLTSGWDVSLDA